MPKRTNPFQDLVSLVQRTLVSQGAKVTDSAMVPVEGLGALREIDILIESEVGPYRLKIAVEAKDHKRKLDIEDLEAIIAKYRGSGNVQVNKVVVVAHRGFSKTAIKRAKFEDIELFTLAEAKGNTMRRVLDKAAHQTSVAAFGMHVGMIEFKPELPFPLDRATLSRAEFICKCCGKSKGSPIQHADHVLHKHLWSSRDFRNRLVKADKRFPEGVCAKVEYPRADVVLRLDGHNYPITHLILHIHGHFKATLTTAQTYHLSTADGQKRAGFLHLRQEVDGKGVSLVIPEGPHPEKISIKFDEGFIRLPCCHPHAAHSCEATPHS